MLHQHEAQIKLGKVIFEHKQTPELNRLSTSCSLIETVHSRGFQAEAATLEAQQLLIWQCVPLRAELALKCSPCVQ